MEKATKLADHIARVRARKAELGITDDDIAKMRNSGLLRTPEKREFLRRIQERAIAAGKTPLPANY